MPAVIGRTGHFTGVWEVAQMGESDFSYNMKKEWVLSSLKVDCPLGLGDSLP